VTVIAAGKPSHPLSTPATPSLSQKSAANANDCIPWTEIFLDHASPPPSPSPTRLIFHIMPHPLRIAIQCAACLEEEDAAGGSYEAEGGTHIYGEVSSPGSRQFSTSRDDEGGGGGGKEDVVPLNPMDMDVDRRDNVDAAITRPQEMAPCFGDRLDRLGDAADRWDALVERESRDHYAVVPVLPSPSSSSSDGEDNVQYAIPEHVREGLCCWCYSIVDKYDIPRYTVGTAMSYFDRLVATGVVERRDWDLVVTSSLFLAVKVNSRGGRIFFPEHMARECKHDFDADQILDMEHHICHVFDWYLNPPGPGMFVDVITPTIMTEAIWEYDDFDAPVLRNKVVVDHAMRHSVIQQAKYLSELSVIYSFFVDKAPSSIAYASILVAMRLGNPHRFAEMERWYESLDLDHDHDETALCVDRLLRLIGCDDHLPDIVVDPSPPVVVEGAGGGAAKKSRARAVTPTKDDLLPSGPDASNMRTESLFDEIGGGGGGDEDVALESPKKKGRRHLD
jgi:hypothetical protein